MSLTNQDAIANHDNAHFDVHMDNIIGWNTRVINPHPMVTNTPSVVYGPPEVTSTPFSTRHPASKTRPVTFQLSENAPDFVPSHQRPPYKVSTPNLITESVNDPATVNQTSEITRFLLHKEILLSGLTNFNDRAESYYVWKNSFKSVIDEAKVSDSQQLNLLVKWLGVESTKQAESIRRSNADNPTECLMLLWNRLDTRYGSPEMVEASLKARLTNFPKLTNKDNIRLYELSDLLSEIEYTKENPKFRTLLGYFDSSSGIRPIVGKLPYGLQEKWTTRASTYKSRHDVPFPPFTEFSKFIREMSIVRNDPGFNYEQELPSTTKYTGKQFPGARTRVIVK